MASTPRRSEGKCGQRTRPASRSARASPGVKTRTAASRSATSCAAPTQSNACPSTWPTPEAPRAVIPAARAALGPLDALVANHARSAPAVLGRTHRRGTRPLLRRQRARHPAARLTLRRAAPLVEGGRIVLFTSGQYHGAMPDELSYIASRAVLQQLTASLAVALAPRKSR
jgi:NAD(P)-dependent dehydrogenase (short-subunit alcohol dehydrogenase family)